MKSVCSGSCLTRFLARLVRDYTFNTKTIMMGENGTSYCTIRQVFGLNFVGSNVVCCQMHCKNDIIRHPSELVQVLEINSKNICHDMCSTATVAQYNE